jgi:hypothetical protein
MYIIQVKNKDLIMSFYCEPCNRYVSGGQCINCSTLNGAAVVLNDCNNQNLMKAAIQTNEIAAVHIPAAAARPEAPRLTIPSNSAAHSTRVNKTPQIKPGFLPITSIPHSVLMQRAYDPVRNNDNLLLWREAYGNALSKVLTNAELDKSRQKTPASDGPPREKTSPIFRSQALETIQARMQPPPPPANTMSSSSSASSNVQTIVHPIHYDPSNLPNAMNQTERTGSEERAPTLTVSSVSSDKICQMVGYAAARIAANNARIAANKKGITKEKLSLPSDNLLEDGRFNLGQACRRTVETINAAMQPPPPPANTMSSGSSASSNVRKRSRDTRDNSSASNPQSTKKVSFSGPGPAALSSPAANLSMTVDSSLENPSTRHLLPLAFREYIEQRNQNDSAEARSSNAATLLSKIRDYSFQTSHYLYQFLQEGMNPLDELDAATCMNDDQKNGIYNMLHDLQRKVRSERSSIEDGKVRSLIKGTTLYTERMNHIHDLLWALIAKKSSFALKRVSTGSLDKILNGFYQDILKEYGESLNVDDKVVFDSLNKKEKIVDMFMKEKNFNRQEFVHRLETLEININRDFCSYLREDRLQRFGTDISQFRQLVAPLSTNRMPLPFPLSSSSFSSSSSSQQQQQRETRQSDDPLLVSLFPELAGLPSP